MILNLRIFVKQVLNIFYFVAILFLLFYNLGMEDFVLRTCCFTGHRPNKFPWGYDENNPACKEYKNNLKEIILSLYKKGINWFIVGGAVGFAVKFCCGVLVFIHVIKWIKFNQL